MILVDHGTPWFVIVMICGGVAAAWLAFVLIERRWAEPVQHPPPWETWL